MKAVILAGGLGTRLRQETEFRPKPMVEIGGLPIIWHIMKHLRTQGISDFVIAAGYKSEVIKDYFLNYETRKNDFTLRLGDKNSIKIHGEHDEFDWTVTVAHTGDETQTGGRIRKVAQYLSDDPFLVVYGDGVTDVNVARLVEQHHRQGRLATVTITQPPSHYGVVQLQGEQVASFQEKPKLDGWVNIGYFVFQPEVMDLLENSEALEAGPLVTLASQGQLGAYKHNGFWQPMDTYRETVLLNELWLANKAPWKTW